MITFIRLLSLYVVVLGIGTASGEIMYFEVLEDDICVEYEGERPAYGLCNAYCNALDCAAEELNGKGKSNACDRIKKNFQRFTGEELLPCEEVSPPPENCPCFGAVELSDAFPNPDDTVCSFTELRSEIFDGFGGSEAFSQCDNNSCSIRSCSIVIGEVGVGDNVSISDISESEDNDCRAVIDDFCSSTSGGLLTVPTEVIELMRDMREYLRR